MMPSQKLKSLSWFMLRQAQHERIYRKLQTQSPFALSCELVEQSKGDKDFLRDP